jgi:hypothetical protein
MNHALRSSSAYVTSIALTATSPKSVRPLNEDPLHCPVGLRNTRISALSVTGDTCPAAVR